MISSLSFRVMFGYARVGNSPFRMACIVLECGGPYGTSLCLFYPESGKSPYKGERGSPHVSLDEQSFEAGVFRSQCSASVPLVSVTSAVLLFWIHRDPQHWPPALPGANTVHCEIISFHSIPPSSQLSAHPGCCSRVFVGLPGDAGSVMSCHTSLWKELCTSSSLVIVLRVGFWLEAISTKVHK